MPLAHYYDVDRELDELKHRGEFLPMKAWANSVSRYYYRTQVLLYRM